MKEKRERLNRLQKKRQKKKKCINKRKRVKNQKEERERIDENLMREGKKEKDRGREINMKGRM